MQKLSPDQVSRLETVIGSRTTLLGYCLGSMMVTNPADQQAWKPTNVSGAIAFCLDKELNTKSIRIYSPPAWILGLKQDLDEKANYIEEAPTFHILQKGNLKLGFAIEDSHAAKVFHATVKSVLKMPVNMLISPVDDGKKGGNQKKLSMSSSGTKKKGGFMSGLASLLGVGADDKEKFEVSAPYEFQHVSHMGYDVSSGKWDVNNIPQEWKETFKAAGIRKKDLQSKEIAEKLYAAINDFSKSSINVKQVSQLNPPSSGESSPAVISRNGSIDTNQPKDPVNIPSIDENRPSSVVESPEEVTFKQLNPSISEQENAASNAVLNERVNNIETAKESENQKQILDNKHVKEESLSNLPPAIPDAPQFSFELPPIPDSLDINAIYSAFNAPPVPDSLLSHHGTAADILNLPSIPPPLPESPSLSGLILPGPPPPVIRTSAPPIISQAIPLVPPSPLQDISFSQAPIADLPKAAIPSSLDSPKSNLPPPPPPPVAPVIAPDLNPAQKQTRPSATSSTLPKTSGISQNDSKILQKRVSGDRSAPTGLLQEIQQGIQLKHVVVDVRSMSKTDKKDLESALRERMKDIRIAMADKYESQNDSTDDDDW